MSEQHPSRGTYHLRTSVPASNSWYQLAIILGLLFFFTAVCALAGAIGGISAAFMFQQFGIPIALALMFIGGGLLGLTSVVGLNNVVRLLKRDQRQLKVIENRLIGGNSADVLSDLHAMIDGNLKLKRFQVADFYSRQLMELSHSDAKSIDGMRSTECWVSTRQYQKSYKYWLVWLFQSRGTLCLSADRLQYSSKNLDLNVPLADIIDLSLASHPRWLKPIPLNFIVLKCFIDGEPDELYLTPSLSQVDCVWQVNDAVSEWLATINRAREEQTKRLAMTCDSLNQLDHCGSNNETAHKMSA